MPYYNKSKDRWVGGVTRNGKRGEEKLFLTKGEARSYEEEQRKLPLESFLRGTPTVYTFMSWANDYLAFAEKFAGITHEEKRLCFDRLFAAFDIKGKPLINPEAPAVSVDKSVILTYMQDWLLKLGGGNVCNRALKNLMAAYQWGIKYKNFPRPNPYTDIDKFPGEEHPRYVPPLQDFWRTYEAADVKGKCYLLCILHTAARKGEILKLKREHVNLYDKTIRLFTKKRKDGKLESDVIPMTGELYEVMRKHLMSHTNEYVFFDEKTGKPYAKRGKYVQKLCLKAGITKFGAHSIRHLAARVLADDPDITLKTIQAILRHRNLITTQRYVGSLKELGKAVESLSRNTPCLTLIPGGADINQQIQ